MISLTLARWASAGAGASARPVTKVAIAAALNMNFDIICPFAWEQRVAAPMGSKSNAFRQADRNAAAGPDDRAQHRIAQRLAGAMLARSRLMLELFGAEQGDVRGQRR